MRLTSTASLIADEASSPARLRSTYLEVSLPRLTCNIRRVREYIGPRRLLAVIKADAYGHGLTRVARHLESLVDGMSVACLSEALEVRRAGVECPLLVLSDCPREAIHEAIEARLTLTAATVDDLREIDTVARRLGSVCRVHINIDTGMGRLGACSGEAERLVGWATCLRTLLLTGIYSHFASADDVCPADALAQWERFSSVLQRLRQGGHRLPLTHMAASGAVLQHPHVLLDAVRPGIVLYGIMPSSPCRATVDVQPVMAWRARIARIRRVPAGTTVGYGSIWRAKRRTRLAVVPVGYADGYARHMTGRAEVLLRGRRVPVVGRISMDQIVLDLGPEPAAHGDIVTLVGRDGDDELSWSDLARWADTIPYEMLTRLPGRVPRIYTSASAHNTALDSFDAGPADVMVQAATPAGGRGGGPPVSSSTAATRCRLARGGGPYPASEHG